MPTAVIFPGQASQTPDMRERAVADRPDLVELVAEIVGEDPFARADEDTRFAQPAIACASLASWSVLRDRLGESPAAFAGHSLGEVAALAAAGALSEEDALRLVALRGRLMSECDVGSMVAVLGGDGATVTEVAERHGVAVANDNAPGQLVLSGERAALAQAVPVLRAAGARTLELNVSGAFHSPLMEPAVKPFEAALAATAFRLPAAPVWSSVTCASVSAPAVTLAAALTRPVRWRQTVEALHAAGIDRFVEAGPGQVLTRLVRRTLDGVEAIAADRITEPANV